MKVTTDNPVAQSFCSVRTLTSVSLSVITLVLGGCSGQNHTALVGSWQTDVILSEWGSNRITVTYYADGRFSQSNDFVGGGVLGGQGTYQVRGGTIVRTLQGATQEIAFAIAGNTMRQKVGNEDYTLTRIITEPDGAANGSHPIRAETNRTSPAAGFRR
jgi:hypothetical protein